MLRLITVLGLLASACSAGATSETSTTPSEAPGPDPGYVVWVSPAGVFTKDMPGADMERLGPDDDSFPTQPTPGPGGRLAWSELTATGGKIAISEPDQPVRRLVAPTSPFYYSWSPDGEKLAFLGSGPGSLIFGVVEGTEARQVDTGAPYYFDWSPDSESLFVHRVGTDLGVLTLDGERVVIDESPAVFQAPQWTTEGVVYAARGAGTFARSGSGVMLATADEPADLVTAAAPGEEPQLIATLASFSAFDRSGDRVAVLGFDGRRTGTLRVVDLDAGTTTVLTDRVLAHRWSPDGDSLLMLRLDEDGNATWDVWDGDVVNRLVSFAPTTSFLRDYLPFWDQYSRSLTLWSPTSDAFTFAGRIDGESQNGIYVRYLDGRLERLGDGTFSAWGSHNS